MSGENDLQDAESKLKRHLENIDNYISYSKCHYASYQDDFNILADMTPYELSKKTQDELFDIAFILYSYAAFLQDEINKHKSVMIFCQNELDVLMAKHRNDYGFDKYTKHEAKKPIIIFENSHAAKLEELRFSAETKLTMLDGKVYELKRQADILNEKAKRK